VVPRKALRRHLRQNLIITVVAAAALIAWQALRGEFGWGDALVVFLLAVLVGGLGAVRDFTRDRTVLRGSTAPGVDWPEAREARRSLPDGWRLDYPDRERFRLPGQEVLTHVIGASGPGGEAFVVVGLGEQGAYRQVARKLRGDLEESDGWVPQIPQTAAASPKTVRPRSFRVEPYAEAALAEARHALKPGWVVYDSDRERLRAGNRSVVVYAVSAVGPGGEAILALGVGQDGAFIQLTGALRGEIEPSEGWAVPLPPASAP
jgi:hypothetical protein